MIHIATNLLGLGVLVQLFTRDTDAAASSGGAAQGIIATVGSEGGRSLEATRADVNGALVGGVPVTSDWGVLGQRQVGLGLINFLGLVCVLVDDRLIIKNFSKSLDQFYHLLGR